MALTSFQQQVCKLIAENRISAGNAYVAGGAALNESLGAPRISRDLDLFHDTEEALGVCWDADRKLFEEAGFALKIIRERPSFVEAIVSHSSDAVLVEWACDSAFRFFPLLSDDMFGLVLHPFDLATNKVLALAGRLEVRDWIDVMNSHKKIQGLGFLAWAACGKDPGFSPSGLLAEARRANHFSSIEVEYLAFEGAKPNAVELGKDWHKILHEAEETVALLPEDYFGMCVLDAENRLFQGGNALLAKALKTDSVNFHEGCIQGTMPVITSRKG